MIPLTLEIEGLYSYKERQVVDFTQLTAAGLFGIFGAVGSGKSSILEAILLALYGSTERLSDRGEKNSMLNLQSEAVKIIFEFRSGKNNTHTYRSLYAAKRNPKKFEEVKPAEHTFYQWEDAAWTPIAKGAEEILGMKKEHFKQTVIIPQGKFREFIDLTPGPRADMMKELFGLERFDLAAKTGGLLRTTKDEKIRLETQLAGLEGVNEPMLSSKKSQVQQLADEVEKQQQEFKRQEQVLKTQESLQVKYHELQGFLKEWKLLEEKRPAIQEKKTIWKEFLKAKTYLKPVWEQMQEKKLDLEKAKVSAEGCQRFKDSYVAELQKYELEEQQLRKKAELKPEREAKIRDLKRVIDIQVITQEVDAAKAIMEKLLPSILQEKEDLQALSDQLKALEQQLDSIPTVDSNALADLKTKGNNLQRMQEQLQKLAIEQQKLTQTTEKLKDSINTLTKQIPENEGNFSAWLESQKSAIHALEAQKEKLIQKAGLAAHIHLLKDNEPCPLCGSLEHPQVLENEPSEAIQAVVHTIEQAQKQLEQIRSLQETVKQEEIRLEGQLQQQTILQKNIQQIQEEQKVAWASLHTLGIATLENLFQAIQETEQHSIAKAELEKNIKNKRKAWDELQRRVTEEEQKLRTAEQQLLALQSKQLAKREEIQDPTFCQPFFEKAPASIEATIQKVQIDIDETASLLEGKLKVIQDTKTKQATNLSSLQYHEESIVATNKRIAQLGEEFKQLMLIHGFANEEQLIALFHHSLDADKVDAEIRQFEDRSLLVSTKIGELTSETGVDGFSQEYFEQLKQQVQLQKAALDSLQKDFTLLDKEITTLEKQLEEKQQLLQIFSQVENRESNLKELEKLFKGSGFVKYVSSIYLKELCNTANLRFMKLTKNSLSLEIDDNNTFWVVDYLNGGKRRLLKTLSGGQTFQASLCLALALAEKVKALNQADQSFFFLDEGFGALDKNSLRVVFETLKSLRHENRIVGIISHVEELQQEIGVYAQVELDGEKGSVVSYSY
ncbi:SbcC/MukB-like Walker B domain-containing protein [Mongoliitalea daihaiensis]|uniref:SbcC/MukB-like Walker B domain-containing protein n=1 Tax=Mongoliitalea daihaiensis TaxID=2782006 RepID=UPI001F2C384D|nr:SMC family ATPase [Mongoliitalea daihaiensis]UJP66551.1 SMC family ATPase [Mongoliitalea daihaiensis]